MIGAEEEEGQGGRKCGFRIGFHCGMGWYNVEVLIIFRETQSNIGQKVVIDFACKQKTIRLFFVVQ